MSTATATWSVVDRTATPDPRFRAIVDAVAGLAGDGHRTGSLEVVVRHGDHEVLRLWAGPDDHPVARAGGPLVAVCGSAFKPALALCLLQALDRADIDVDAPLTTFGAGLHDPATTSRHVVDHTAGLPHIRAVAPDPVDLIDGAAVLAAIRHLPPLWAPGERSAYHAVSYGYLVQAACEDLTGESVTDLLWDLVLGPAGIGPDEVLLPGDAARHDQVTPLEVVGDPIIPWRPEGRSLLYRALYSLADLVDHLNSPGALRDPVLSCGVPCQASALAKLYSAVVAPGDGPGGLTPEVRDHLLAPGVVGFDQVMRQRLTWRGGVLGGAGIRQLSGRPRLIGLPGYGGSMGLGDADTGVAVGIVATQMDADRVVGRDCEAIGHALDRVLDDL